MNAHLAAGGAAELEVRVRTAGDERDARLGRRSTIKCRVMKASGRPSARASYGTGSREEEPDLDRVIETPTIAMYSSVVDTDGVGDGVGDGDGGLHR